MTEFSMLEKLKLVSKACNSSSNFEQFIVNLDLIDMTLDEAEKLYEDNCKDLMRHMSPFWLEDRKFKLHRVFDDHSFFQEHGIKRFALPYRFYHDKDKNCGNVIKLCAVTMSGEEEIDSSYELIEDIQAMYRIDIFHEIVITMMIDIAKKAGLERNYGC